MGLDSGRIGLNTTFDARMPLRDGKFTIKDYHAQKRVLTVPEIFTYSSNIGTARLALSLGVDYHKAWLKKMGQLDRLYTEIPESAMPIVPKRWGELNTITIAFGHGLSVAPLQATMAVGALMNGGQMIPPTFLKRSEEEAKKLAVQVIKPDETYTRPIPIMAFHGDNDTFVTTARGRAARDRYLARNKCGTETKPATPSPCVEYQGCSAPTFWCEFPGGHNTWSEEPPAIWKFFSQF
jgi:cell division protein FtsI (penicillin-binding protein 3)